MKRAVAAWSSRRRARGNVPYAVSRISDVLERVLGVALDLALRPTMHEPPILERFERFVDVLDLADPLHHVAPERRPDHRRIQERRPRGGRQRVDARGDRGPDGRGELVGVGIVLESRNQFLDEQRVPAGGGDDAFDGVGVRRAEQRADDLGGLGGR